jgi:dephospho-CoA kinase
LANQNNLDKIIKIVHPKIKEKMNIFLKKHKDKKIVILDIPLLLENKINKKKDILVFVQSKKSIVLKRLKKRKNINYKKKKSQFIIKNDFTPKSVRKSINNILKKII